MPRRWRGGASGRERARAPSAAEGVAAGRVARLVAALEPRHALLGGAVGPGLRVHVDPRAGLDPVVADRCGGSQALLDVAGLQVALLVDGLRPDAREAVGLELHLHGQAVDLLLRPRLLLELADLALDAGHRLHVVADLVGDDVRLREVARGPEAPVELREEVEVDVDLAVG